MDILINILGMLLILFIIWWFWLTNTTNKIKATNTPIDIKVEGGIYIPDTIEVRQGQPVKLRFTRRDPSPCAETVVFENLGVSQNLPYNDPVIIQLTIERTGQYKFTCPMGMYRGKLIVI